MVVLVSRLDLARMEGIAVGLLCTNDAEVRRQALEILKTLRTLHRSLLASCEPCPQTSPCRLCLHETGDVRKQGLHSAIL